MLKYTHINLAFFYLYNLIIYLKDWFLSLWSIRVHLYYCIMSAWNRTQCKKREHTKNNKKGPNKFTSLLIWICKDVVHKMLENFYSNPFYISYMIPFCEALKCNCTHSCIDGKRWLNWCASQRCFSQFYSFANRFIIRTLHPLSQISVRLLSTFFLKMLLQSLSVFVVFTFRCFVE